MNFVAALNDRHRVFTWGDNSSGVLGRLDSIEKRLKPAIVNTLKDTDISDLSCNTYHTLALAINGQVYEWGDTIITSDNRVLTISTPVLVDFGEHTGNIGAVYCSFRTSLALTIGGQVYVWPHNYRPVIIDGLCGIRSIATTIHTIYLLTGAGVVYFCDTSRLMDDYSNSDDGSAVQMAPEPVISDHTFSKLYSLQSYQIHDQNIVGITSDSNLIVIIYRKNEMSNTIQMNITEFDNIIDIFANTMQMTYKTIRINNNNIDNQDKNNNCKKFKNDHVYKGNF
jgi:hypothetical protein